MPNEKRDAFLLYSYYFLYRASAKKKLVKDANIGNAEGGKMPF